MPNYENSQIYIIRNFKDERVYIGSTTRTLAQRMAQHRTGAKKEKSYYKLYEAFKEVGVDQFYIERLEEFPCRDKSALLSREGHFIRTYNSVKDGLNGRIAGRTKEERRKDPDVREINHTRWINLTDEQREARRKDKRERHHERYHTDLEYRSEHLKSNKLYRANATPEVRARYVEATRKHRRNLTDEQREEQRKRDRDSRRERYETDPEYRASIIEREALKRNSRSEEERTTRNLLRRQEHRDKSINDPDYRAKYLEARRLECLKRKQTIKHT